MKATKRSKSAKIISLIAQNPTMKAKEIATKVGVKVQYVYQVMHKLKNSASDLAYKASQGNAKKRGRPSKTMTLVATVSSNTSVATAIKSAADNVNHPAHYKTGGIETIDFIEAKGLDYHLGNVVKYITRADHKGNRKEDLLKAQWYLNRAISKLEK